MGLLNRTYDTDSQLAPNMQRTQWERFAHYVNFLNKQSNENVEYKVLYLARHGEAYHNVAQSYYGANCWDVCSLTTLVPFCYNLICSVIGPIGRAMGQFHGEMQS